MKDLMRCRRGATAIEYGLFAGLAAIVLMSGASTIGAKVGGTFANAGAAMAAAPDAPPPSDGSLRATAGEARLIRVEESREGFLDRNR
jgi:pilus assembly protein Flp/PilA